jgi:hypothetical protein
MSFFKKLSSIFARKNSSIHTLGLQEEPRVYSEKAYQLLGDISRLGYMESGDSYDLKPFSFPNSAEFQKIYRKSQLDLPDPVFFYIYSTLKYIKELDSLSAHLVPAIFSQRIIDILSSVRDFSYRIYPIAILEEGAVKFQKKPDGYKAPEPYSDPDSFAKKSIRNDLFIFQPLEVLENVFDWENSNYKQGSFDIERGSPGYIREFVFKEPSGGFPPIFRIKESSTTFFISAEAREALRIAGARGFSFLSLRGYSPTSQSQVDVPI